MVLRGSYQRNTPSTMYSGKGRMTAMGVGTKVAIVIADLAAWLLIMVIVGKWRAIMSWCRTVLSRNTSPKAGA